MILRQPYAIAQEIKKIIMILKLLYNFFFFNKS